MNSPLLKLDCVTKRFRGLTAVDRVNMTVDEGQIVGIVGPNGSGKTTTFACVSGFLRPEEGRVIFQGKDITGLQPYQIARLGISRTFQIVQSFEELTVLDNVVLGALKPDEANHSISIAEARNRAAERPVEVDQAVEIIKKIRDRGVTIVVVEHLMRAVLALSEKLYVIHHGAVLAQGIDPREVLGRPEVVDAYFGKATLDA